MVVFVTNLKDSLSSSNPLLRKYKSQFNVN